MDLSRTSRARWIVSGAMPIWALLNGCHASWNAIVRAAAVGLSGTKTSQQHWVAQRVAFGVDGILTYKQIHRLVEKISMKQMLKEGGYA